MTSSTKPEVRITYHNAVREGPRHGHRQHAQKVGEAGCVAFKLCKQTETHTNTQSDILITVLHNPTAAT